MIIATSFPGRGARGSRRAPSARRPGGSPASCPAVRVAPVAAPPAGWPGRHRVGIRHRRTDCVAGGTMADVPPVRVQLQLHLVVVVNHGRATGVTTRCEQPVAYPLTWNHSTLPASVSLVITFAVIIMFLRCSFRSCRSPPAPELQVRLGMHSIAVMVVMLGAEPVPAALPVWLPAAGDHQLADVDRRALDADTAAFGCDRRHQVSPACWSSTPALQPSRLKAAAVHPPQQLAHELLLAAVDHCAVVVLCRNRAGRRGGGPATARRPPACPAPRPSAVAELLRCWTGDRSPHGAGS